MRRANDDFLFDFSLRSDRRRPDMVQKDVRQIMYEELIAALNAADKRPCSDLECPGSGECPTVGCLFREAADAIEELLTQTAEKEKDG